MVEIASGMKQQTKDDLLLYCGEKRKNMPDAFAMESPLGDVAELETSGRRLGACTAADSSGSARQSRPAEETQIEGTYLLG